MATTPIHQWIDRWQSRGLLTPGVADRLRADVAATQPEDAPAPSTHESTIDRVLSAARGGVVEALGYLGAAVTLGALGVLVDLETWGDTALLLLTLVVAGVAGAGVFALTPPTSATTRRLAGVLGLTSVAATAGTLVQLLAPECADACTAWQEVGVPLVISAATAGVAALLYGRHRHLLTHVGLGSSVAATAMALGLALAGPSADYTTRDAWVGGLLFVACIAWVLASEATLLPPAWLGTMVAGGVSFAGLVMATSPWDAWLFGTDDGDVTVLVALGLAIAYTVAGAVTSRLRPTIVGAVGLVVTVPWTFTDVFGWSGRQTAGVLLPVGIALTAWAVVAGREWLRVDDDEAAASAQAPEADRSAGS